jgi:MmoB/DmpM family
MNTISKEPGHTAAGRDTVGISLMSSSDTEAAVALIREEQPEASVSFRGCFYKVECAGVLEFDMAKLTERLGRPIDTDGFLVNMSTYYGRMVVSDGLVQIYSDIQPERFR